MPRGPAARATGTATLAIASHDGFALSGKFRADTIESTPIRVRPDTSRNGELSAAMPAKLVLGHATRADACEEFSRTKPLHGTFQLLVKELSAARQTCLS